MATIDKLLLALVKNRMDALVLEPERLPRLVRGGAEHDVTKSVLPAESVRFLLREVAGGEPPASGAWEFGYDFAGQHFAVRAEPGERGWRAVARPASAAPPPQAPPPQAAPAQQTAPAFETAPAPAPPAEPAPAPRAPAAEPPAAAAEPSGRRPLPDVRELLALTVERKASDLHLSTDQPVRLRIDGDLVLLDDLEPPSAEALERLLFAITPEANREEWQTTRDTDFGFELPGQGRFRVNLYAERLGIGGAFRLIPNRIPTLEELGLPESVRKLAELNRGLVLVTGPTGSGKSTTLAALIDLVNSERRDHIITIEDPIEFVHASKGCLVHQRHVGVHTKSFAKALRAALREDPDVVMVGEMRDLETTAIALQTAETGHLVFGTLHTTSAPSTVERLIDQFPSEQQSQIRLMFADSLKAVISQNLLKRRGGGRVAAFEVLLGTPAINNMIREGKTFQITSAMQTGRRQGMALLNDSLASLVERELVAPEEAYFKAADKEDLVKRLRTAGADLGFLDAGAGTSPAEGG